MVSIPLSHSTFVFVVLGMSFHWIQQLYLYLEPVSSVLQCPLKVCVLLLRTGDHLLWQLYDYNDQTNFMNNFYYLHLSHLRFLEVP